MPLRRKSILRTAVLQLGLLILSLAAAEVALQIAARTNRSVQLILAAPWETVSPVVPDATLIHRGNPLRRDHDDRGYRNERVLDTADIVTLGDSQTYGLVDSPQAWPRLLARRLGVTVYNMALPGYGPGQSLLQLDDALALRPRVVTIAPYFGNDLYESFALARIHPSLSASAPADLRHAADALERQQPLKEKIMASLSLQAAPEETSAPNPRDWVSRNVKLYALLRTVKHRLTTSAPSDPLLSRRFETAAAALPPAHRQYASPVEASGWRTILTSGYRFQVVDDRDPRLRLGFEVMRAAIRRTAERCRASGVRLLVLLVPTKESVFWPRVANPDDHTNLRPLVANENRLRAELTATLVADGIEVLDLLDILRQSPAQPYPEDTDGHPNPLGNQVIAEAVATRLSAGTR